MPFSPPESFRRIHADGRFDYWGAPYHSLSAEQRERLLQTRPFQVLFWKTIEWDEDSSPDAVEAFQGDDELRPGLVPFAGNGHGDRYCWYPRWQTDEECPVVFFTHDELESPLFARSFEECLVRCMLRHFADWDEEDDGDAKAQRKLWDAHQAILLPLLPERLAAVLRDAGLALSPQACEAADSSLEQQIGERSLVGAQLPTQYADEHFDDKEDLLRCYDESLAFYRELVEDEGYSEFAKQLQETRANRDRVAASRG